MSVRPVSFDDGNGMWEYFHDERGHGGIIDPSTVTYVQDIEGSPHYNAIIIQCPEDGWTSTWPVGGGADALMGQTMFCIKEVTLPQNRDRSVRSVSDSVKQRVIDTDGEERWVMDEAALTLVAKVTGRSLD